MDRNYNHRYANEYGFIATKFYRFFLHTVVDAVMKYCYKYTINGKENIPNDGKKYIYAANHVAQFDPPIVAFITRKTLAFMAKSELFDSKDRLLRWLVIHLGAFAVNREKPEIATFKTLKELSKTKWDLAIFPQGGTFPYGSNIYKFKKGFVTIAKKTHCDIVPIAIADFSDYPKSFKYKEQTFNVHIGKPISYELDESEIEKQWCDFIYEHADYKKS